MHPYATLAYARTLAHVGYPHDVPEWRTHVIARRCNGTAVDAMGPYPVTCLPPDCDLSGGLARLRGDGFVSVTLVLDGRLAPAAGQLAAAFSFVRPFKTQYVVDCRSERYEPTKHHRAEIRRAERHGVEARIVDLHDILPSWNALYDALIARHRITGSARFTHASFEALASCDGLTTVAAFLGGSVVSCHLWFRHGQFVWSHLACTSAIGYSCAAAYAVYDHSIRHFSGHLINLGGIAGNADAADDGLARVKAGFSNGTCTSYLAGSVLDERKYAHLCQACSLSTDSGYFPAYRTPSTTGES